MIYVINAKQGRSSPQDEVGRLPYLDFGKKNYIYVCIFVCIYKFLKFQYVLEKNEGKNSLVGPILTSFA